MDAVTKATNVFVEWAKDKLEGNKSEEVVQAALPQRKFRKKKRYMPGEEAEKEHTLIGEDQYRIRVHNIILDTVTESIQTCYSANGALYDDLSASTQGTLTH